MASWSSVGLKNLTRVLVANGCLSVEELRREKVAIERIWPDTIVRRSLEDCIRQMNRNLQFMNAEVIDWTDPCNDTRYVGITFNMSADHIPYHSFQQFELKEQVALFRYLFFVALNNKGLFDNDTVKTVRFYHTVYIPCLSCCFVARTRMNPEQYRKSEHRCTHRQRIQPYNTMYTEPMSYCA